MLGALTPLAATANSCSQYQVGSVRWQKCIDDLSNPANYVNHMQFMPILYVAISLGLMAMFYFVWWRISRRAVRQYMAKQPTSQAPTYDSRSGPDRIRPIIIPATRPQKKSPPTATKKSGFFGRRSDEDILAQYRSEDEDQDQ